MQTVYQVNGELVALVQPERVKLYRWGNPRPVWSRAFRGASKAVAATAQAIYVATATHLHRLPRRDADPVQTYELPTAHGAPTLLFAYESSQGSEVALGTERGVLYGARLPEARWTALRLSRSSIGSGALFEDRWLVLGDTDGQAYCVEWGRWKQIAQWQGGAGGVLDWSWHPAGRWVAGACADGLVKWWDATSGKWVSAYAGHRLYPVRVAVRPDGRWIGSVGAEGLVWVYDVEAGRSLHDYVVSTPREAGEVLAMRWGSAQMVQLLTPKALWERVLPKGDWRSRELL